MAALWRRAAFLSFLRRSVPVLFRHSKHAGHKFGKWTSIVNSSIVSFSVGAGLCAVPFTQVQNLSHDSLVRRAASLVTNSSSTFLSQTTFALIDTITEYSKAVHTLIALQKQYLASLGKLTRAEEDSIWQVIISQRAEVNDRQVECKRFESTWINAVKLCESAAEAAYSSGAEEASIMVQTNIQVAQSQVQEALKVSQDANKKLAETKVMEVERTTQHAVSLENNNDEEDIPEAYLRED